VASAFPLTHHYGAVLPGVLKLHSGEVSWFWGCGTLKFLKKLFFQGNLCYHAADEKIQLQEQKFGGIFPGPRGPKTILGCGGKGCRIISDYAADEKSRFQKRKYVRLQPVRGLPKTVFLLWCPRLPHNLG
jgi:hypothetical protein